MTRSAVAGVAVAALVAAAGRPAGAVEVRTFSVRAHKEWLEGEGAGVRISGKGELEPAYRDLLRLPVEESVIWSAAASGDGSVWLGTGGGGVVYRAGRLGNLDATPPLAEGQVTAALADGLGGVVATSPGGAVYSLEPGAKPRVLGRPAVRYLWALARGRDGALYAASGVEGAVWRIAQGEATRHFEAPDQHVTSLAVRADGTLVAGTAERGLVLAIAAAGKASVLYDSEHKEVRALLAEPDGGLVAAVNGGPSFRDPGGAPRPGEATVNVSAGGGQPDAEGAQAGQQQLFLPPPEAVGEVSSEIVRLPKNGPPEVLARLKGELVYSLVRDARGRLLAGTSRRIIEPVAGEEPASIALEDGGQVSALVRSGDAVVAATTGPSRLRWLSGSEPARGKWTSKVFDAGDIARWGALRWDADVPAGATLAFETRSGGSADPDSTWSEWSKPLTAPGGIASPWARFVQFRLEAVAAPGGAAPRVRGVTLAYALRNQAPAIRSFQAEPPGVVFQKSAAGQNVVEVLPPPLPSMFEELAAARSEPSGQAKRLYRRGAQTLSFEVADPDGDEVVVRLFVRPRDSGPPLLVRERPESSPFTFDSEALPDGWWVARIEADDSPSNPGGGRVATRETEPFRVDNTPPRLEVVESAMSGRKVRVEVRARDLTSPLWKAAWSLDGGSFRPLAPADGLTDGPEELYVVETAPLEPGEHLVVVRVTDLANQAATVAARPSIAASVQGE